MKIKDIDNIIAKTGLTKVKNRKGPTGYTAKQAEVHHYIVIQGLTQGETSRRTGVHQTTISKWNRDFGWADERKARQLSSPELYSKIVLHMAKLSSKLDDIDYDDENNLDKALRTMNRIGDSISKLNSVAKEIMKGYDSLGGILLALDEFTNFLKHNEIRKQHHPELLNTLEQYIPAFSREMAEKYS